MRSGSRITAIILIVLGTWLLLQKRHLIPDFGPLFRDWWPLLLIILGVCLLIRHGRRG